MCIRDRLKSNPPPGDVLTAWDLLAGGHTTLPELAELCLLYTSDAADERSSVDLGGRRIIKKKTRHTAAMVHNSVINQVRTQIRSVKTQHRHQKDHKRTEH